ncbi:MAG: hypothetical protein JXR70_17660 [Spirochaetales bacterium]|nr:hypothetical protein [Spirochaetales bacterium]
MKNPYALCPAVFADLSQDAIKQVLGVVSFEFFADNESYCRMFFAGYFP